MELSKKLKELAREWTVRDADGNPNEHAWFGEELHSLISENLEENLPEAGERLALKWEHGEMPDDYRSMRERFANELRAVLRSSHSIIDDFRANDEALRAVDRYHRDNSHLVSE